MYYNRGTLKGDKWGGIIKKLDEGIPIYQQIFKDIKSKIISGKIKNRDKLPSVRELAQSYMVNPNTIQRVFMELDREDLLATERGIGTFVKINKARLEELKDMEATNAILEYINEMRSLGFNDEEIINSCKNKL